MKNTTSPARTDKKLTFQQTIQLARLQAWVMSLVCSFLSLFAAAAAVRIPLYFAASDDARLIGTVLFGLLVLVGVVDNVRTHLCLWRLTNETRVKVA